MTRPDVYTVTLCRANVSIETAGKIADETRGWRPCDL